jgi:hypothetical protein
MLKNDDAKKLRTYGDSAGDSSRCSATNRDNMKSLLEWSIFYSIQGGFS